MPDRAASPALKAALLGCIGLAFSLGGLWRVSADQQFLPGPISVATLLLSIAVFVAFDRRVEFPAVGWVGVTLVISFHQIATVHAAPFPGAFIYLGGSVLRVDHLLHLLAGALVAYLAWHLAATLRPHAPPWLVATVSMTLLVLFGLLKEVSDVLTAVTNGHDLAWVDTAWDTTANVLGGALALGGLIRRRAGA